MENKKITLEVTLEDVNKILQLLGKAPYEQVFHLIGSIQQQASRQLEGNPLKQ